MSEERKNDIVRLWRPITAAPFDAALQLAVIENNEVYALAFPCRRTPEGWSNAETGAAVYVRPTHWRVWSA